MVLFTEITRRGLSHPQTATLLARAAAFREEHALQVPTWGAVLLFVTLFISFVFVSLTSYMLKELVTALCMVESPVAAITISPSVHESGDRDEKEGLLESGPTITLVHQKAITSTIRGTIRHLVANGGRWARFRGLRYHFLYAFCFSAVANITSGLLPRMPGKVLFIAAISGALCANVHAAWTHKVISMPNDKRPWQRIPSRTHWKLLCLPAAIETTMPYAIVYLTCGVAMILGLHNIREQHISEHDCSAWMSIAIRVIVTIVFAVLCTLFLWIPAIVTRVRIEASILPDDEDTIIPFDRTFGGKVVSRLLGGDGVVDYLDAWRSFNWEARRRLLGLYLKSFLIMLGIGFVVVHIVAFEIFAIMGPQLGRFLAQMKHEGFVTK